MFLVDGVKQNVPDYVLGWLHCIVLRPETRACKPLPDILYEKAGPAGIQRLSTHGDFQRETLEVCTSCLKQALQTYLAATSRVVDVGSAT